MKETTSLYRDFCRVAVVELRQVGYGLQNMKDQKFENPEP